MPAWIPCSFRSFLEFLAADGLIYFCHQRSFPRYWLTFYLDAEIIVSVGMTMPQVISPIERVPAHPGNRIPLNRMMWRYRRHMLLQFLPALCISFSSSCFVESKDVCFIMWKSSRIQKIGWLDGVCRSTRSDMIKPCSWRRNFFIRSKGIYDHEIGLLLEKFCFITMCKYYIANSTIVVIGLPPPPLDRVVIDVKGNEVSKLFLTSWYLSVSEIIAINFFYPVY